MGTVFLGKDNTVKLGDFGLSKALQQAAFTMTYVGVSFSPSSPLTLLTRVAL